MPSLIKYLTIISILLNLGAVSGQDGSEVAKISIKKLNRIQLGTTYSNVHYDTIQEHVQGFIIHQNYIIKPRDYFGYGMGGGLQSSKKQMFVPIYLNFIACTKNNFYLDIQPGYSFGWKRKAEYFENSNLKGGFFSKLGIGYKVRLNKEFSSCIQVSYSYQSARLESKNLPIEKLKQHSVILSLGLLLDKN